MNKTAMKIPMEKKNWIVLQIFWIECQNVFCDFYYLIVSYALESCSIKPGSVYIQSCRLDGVLCQSSVYDMRLHVSVCRPSTVTSRSTSSLFWPWCTRQNSSWNTTRRSWPPNRSPNYSSWLTTSSPTCPRYNSKPTKLNIHCIAITYLSAVNLYSSIALWYFTIFS